MSSRNQTHVTRDVPGALGCFYWNCIWLQVITFLLVLLPASFVKFLSSDVKENRCHEGRTLKFNNFKQGSKMTARHWRPMVSTATHITHGHLVHFALQNFWGVWHHMNAGLLFVPLICVQSLQLQRNC